MNLKGIRLPEKIFGIDSGLLVVFLPLLAVVLVVVICVNLIIVPKIGDYNAMNTELNGLERQKALLQEKRQYLESVDLAELKKNADLIGSAILPQNNAYILVGVVRNIADKYGFQVDSFMIRPGELSKEGSKSTVTGVAKIPIRLTVIGPVGKYLDLINGLEKSLPILSLESLDMQNSTEVSKMDIQILAYYIEDSSTFDPNKLTLSDLTLKKEEMDLLTRLNEFSVLENVNQIELEMGGKKEYVKYNREDPFSP
jgi:Tfp pilus assembly protein PilO